MAECSLLQHGGEYGTLFRDFVYHIISVERFLNHGQEKHKENTGLRQRIQLAI